MSTNNVQNGSVENVNDQNDQNDQKVNLPEYAEHDTNKKWIFEEWGRIWKTRSDSAEKEYFFWLFEYDYKETCKKEKKNKKWNFRIKGLCIAGYIIIGVLLFVYLINIKQLLSQWVKLPLPNVNWKNVSIMLTAYLIWGTVLAGIMKWAQVKKFQETWKRHSNHRFKIEMEMFKYLTQYGEYSEEERDKRFMKNIMATWEGNQTKFSKNMDKEEKIGNFNKGLTDGASAVKEFMSTKSEK